MSSARTRVLTKWVSTILVSVAFIAVGLAIGQPVIWAVGVVLVLGDLLIIGYGLRAARRVTRARGV